MDETDDVELDLAELSSLLGAETAPQGITIPVSLAVRAMRDQRAINDFRRALESVCNSSAPAPKGAEDEMKAYAERKASYARLVGGLNALHSFLKQLNLKLIRQISYRRLDKYEQQVAYEKDAITRMVRQWKKDLSSRARNGEAKELFRVTLALIQDNKTNEKMLRKIEARCLKFAHIDGAIADV